MKKITILKERSASIPSTRRKKLIADIEMDIFFSEERKCYTYKMEFKHGKLILFLTVSSISGYSIAIKSMAFMPAIPKIFKQILCQRSRKYSINNNYLLV